MPPKTKLFEVRFPSMGVVRRRPQERVSSSPAYPTPWGVNVRLEDDLTNRLRGGSWTAIAAGSRPDLVYRDRLLSFADNAITATRQGDQTDTALSHDISDTARATLFQLAEAGDTGEDVVALAPHKDKFLVGWTAGELWLVQGDPTTGGMRNISRDIGIIGPDAWTVHHDTIYFLSSHGLYSIGADGSSLKALSEDSVPEDLTGVVDAACTLTYNHADRGVYIHLTSGVDWFYDTARDGFWPFDTSTASSHVLLGPLRLSTANRLGLAQTIHGIMASSSTTVHWKLIVGETAEEASADGKTAITAALAGNDYQEYVSADGAWDAGRSKTGWPRTRGAWLVVWLSSAGSWAYEGVTLEAIPFGRIR